jgi:Skp family chaperone for outer membrane proteins
MQKNKTSIAGWIVAGLLAVLIVAPGFQVSGPKFGVVDFASIVEKSDYFQANQKQLDAMKTAREELLQFLDTYKVASGEQTRRLRELAVKESMTPVEKQEYDNLKADVMNSDKKYKELSTKKPPTPEDEGMLREYATRRQTIDDTLPRWSQEFQNELQGKFAQVRSSAIERGRVAVQDVAKAGGYTVVFRADVAVYGANDITDAALKAMNAKK